MFHLLDWHLSSCVQTVFQASFPVSTDCFAGELLLSYCLVAVFITRYLPRWSLHCKISSAAIFIARIFSLMESLRWDIRMRPGKETRDIFQDCPAAIKAVCSPLAALTLLIKHSELLDVQDRRTGRLCVLVLSGVLSQTLFYRLSVCEIWVLVLFVIEGSRASEDWRSTEPGGCSKGGIETELKFRGSPCLGDHW